jgi:hypothetical protein
MSDFDAAQEKAGIVYAQVNKISPSSSNYRGACESKDKMPEEYRKLFCHRLDEVNQLELGVLTDGAYFVRYEFVSKNISITPGAIVKLDFRRPKGDYYAGVMSAEETETCRWTGRANSRLDGSVKTFSNATGGFMAGLIAPVPTAISMAVNRTRLGGVECNGWDYKVAFHDFLFEPQKHSVVLTSLHGN